MAAKRAPARKTAARKTAARKASTKKAAPRKAAARKSSAKKSTAERSATRKSTAKRSTAKKSATRSTAKKAAARRTATKKAAKRAPAKKKAAAKRAPAKKKAAAKKSPAKKAVAKRSSAAKKSLPRTLSEGMTGASPDAIELLMSDHREVEQLFTQLEAASPDSNVAQDIADKIVNALSVHATIEEQVLYPAARREIEAGEVDHAIEEHQEVKELLTKVDGKSPADDEVRQTFQQIKSSVEEHVQEEENEMFPKLRDRFDQERMQQMGEQLESMKRLAPTRPHPHAPSTPPGNVVAGLGASVVDRIRDRARGRKKE